LKEVVFKKEKLKNQNWRSRLANCTFP
jgi:hypothetical protein